MIRPIIEYFQQIESKNPSTTTNRKGIKMEEEQNITVEVQNKSTQSDEFYKHQLYDIEEEPENVQNENSQKETELEIEVERLKKTIEELLQENTTFKTCLKHHFSVLDKFLSVHEKINANREYLLKEVRQLDQRIKEIQTKLDEELTLLLKLQNDESELIQQNQQQQQTANTRKPKICKKSFQDNVKNLKSSTYKIKCNSNNFGKDKMDNLKIRISKQQQRPIKVSLSIEEIRDKQILQGLKEKLEKSLIFPDVGKLKNETTFECDSYDPRTSWNHHPCKCKDEESQMSYKYSDNESDSKSFDQNNKQTPNESTTGTVDANNFDTNVIETLDETTEQDADQHPEEKPKEDTIQKTENTYEEEDDFGLHFLQNTF